MGKRRRWAATSNPSYEPAEERQGILATLALIGALVALGVILLAASAGGEVEGSGTTSRPDRGAAVTSTPDDLSFLCGGDLGTAKIDLDADSRNQVQKEVERFVLTVYGDPGTDPAGYKRSVAGLIVGECFWESPASGYVNAMEELARAGGKANAPSGSYGDPSFARELSRFEINYARQGEDYESGASFTKVVGTAVWVSEESNGDPRAWQESITVGKSDATDGDWKILSGQTIPPRVDPKYKSYLPTGVGF